MKSDGAGDESSALRRHQVSSEETKIRLSIVLFDGGHEVGGMQVSRCLARYDEVFHTMCRNKNAVIKRDATTTP